MSHIGSSAADTAGHTADAASSSWSPIGAPAPGFSEPGGVFQRDAQARLDRLVQGAYPADGQAGWEAWRDRETSFEELASFPQLC